MSHKFVLEFEELIDINFTQASIYLDACFVLAYLDSNDKRGDRVADLLEKWASDGVEKIAISNLSMSEIVHNLFKNYIRNVLALTYKLEKNDNNKKQSSILEEELEIIHDIETAKKLVSLIPKGKLERLIQLGELQYPIEDLLKQYKSNFPHKRDALHHYYGQCLDVYNEFIREIEQSFKVVVPNSDFDTQLLAQSFMRIYQLSPYDAFHIASTVQNSFDYFATLDSDFVHNYYAPTEIGMLRILKVA